jgi:hypothetical protein
VTGVFTVLAVDSGTGVAGAIDTCGRRSTAGTATRGGAIALFSLELDATTFANDILLGPAATGAVAIVREGVVRGKMSLY